jgi:hypothetical protein
MIASVEYGISIQWPEGATASLDGPSAIPKGWDEEAHTPRRNGLKDEPS